MSDAHNCCFSFACYTCYKKLKSKHFKRNPTTREPAMYVLNSDDTKIKKNDIFIKKTLLTKALLHLSGIYQIPFIPVKDLPSKILINLTKKHQNRSTRSRDLNEIKKTTQNNFPLLLPLYFSNYLFFHFKMFPVKF